MAPEGARAQAEARTSWLQSVTTTATCRQLGFEPMSPASRQSQNNKAATNTPIIMKAITTLATSPTMMPSQVDTPTRSA